MGVMFRCSQGIIISLAIMRLYAELLIHLSEVIYRRHANHILTQQHTVCMKCY